VRGIVRVMLAKVRVVVTVTSAIVRGYARGRHIVRGGAREELKVGAAGACGGLPETGIASGCY
jgi:hypothetical protein